MNDDEVRALADDYGESLTIRALAAEVLRRGEVIATYEAALERYRLLPAIESDHDEPLLDEGVIAAYEGKVALPADVLRTVLDAAARLFAGGRLSRRHTVAYHDARAALVPEGDG